MDTPKNEFSPKLAWPNDYSLIPNDENETEKVFNITPNLYLRISRGTIFHEYTEPTYWYWPDVLWIPNDDPENHTYLDSFSRVDSEMKAMEVLENWLSTFLLDLKPFKNNDQ